MYLIKRISLIVLLNLPAPTLCDLVRTLMPEPTLTSRQQAALLKHRKRFVGESSSEQPPVYNSAHHALPPRYSRVNPLERLKRRQKAAFLKHRKRFVGESSSEQPSVYNSAHHASPPPYSPVDPLERLKRIQEKAFARHIARTRKK